MKFILGLLFNYFHWCLYVYMGNQELIFLIRFKSALPLYYTYHGPMVKNQCLEVSHISDLSSFLIFLKYFVSQPKMQIFNLEKVSTKENIATQRAVFSLLLFLGETFQKMIKTFFASLKLIGLIISPLFSLIRFLASGK